MDCLKLFQPVNQLGIYGLYHSRSNGIFSVHLAHSTDLKTWTRVSSLDTHASQASIWQTKHGGFMMCYEKDQPNSCWIRLRYYKNVETLKLGKHEREFDIPRTLAPTAEGTPSFESVRITGGKLDSSEIKMRFHYYKNKQVDQLAQGTLINFKSWKAESSDKVNDQLIKHGWHGNLGDRDKFIWKDQNYYLQEMQRTAKDWSSWRIGLCDSKGMPLQTLAIKTHSGSTSFANPNATWIRNTKGEKKLVITLFLPSQGNDSKEAGSLLYVIHPVK